MTEKLNRKTYRFDCPLCSTTWSGNDLKKLASKIAWHWNVDHNNELRRSYKQIDTVERGGHNVHKNEWTVERIPIYVTSFDVMKRIGEEDGMAIPPDDENICDTCYERITDSEEHEVIEESAIGNDTVRCQNCTEKKEVKRKKENNEQITEFSH